jgi:putative phosphoesterase
LIIAAAADTHGVTRELIARLKTIKPEHLLFAGDFFRDGQLIARILKVPAHIVAGNCDLDHRDQLELVLAFGDHKILLVHGHQYGVKKDLNRLYYRASELEVDAVVFGHTHQPMCEQHGGLWMINPGSPNRPRRPGPGSFALINIDGQVLRAHLVYMTPLQLH